jgi:hypothetical protein
MLLNAPSSSSSSLNIHDLDTDSSETESDTEFLVGSIVSSVAQAAQSSIPRQISALTGREYVNELLNSGHPARCHDVLRMSLETFLALRTWLSSHTSLRSSRKSKGLSIEEKLVIFLHITARAASVRDTVERFNRGFGCVSR